MDFVDQQLDAAYRMYDAGLYQQAIDHFRNALSEEPNDAEAHAMLALTLVRLKRLGAAEVEASIALQIDAESMMAHLAVGLVASARRNLKLAQTHLDKARELSPFEPVV